MHALPHTHSCFVCGESNSSGLNLRFETDGRLVQARFTPCAEHVVVGFKQTIHGGITATLLDEVMVWACAVQTKRFAYCAELNVRFINPLQPGVETLAIGELTLNRRNKIYEAKGELRDPAGVVLATSVGKYLPIKVADVSEMMVDFVGDASAWISPVD